MAATLQLDGMHRPSPEEFSRSVFVRQGLRYGTPTLTTPESHA